MGGGKESRQPWKNYYKDQGGWDFFTWDGVVQLCFVFSDSMQVGGCLAAGGGDGAISAAFTAAYMAETLPWQFFAGTVCVAD